MISTKMNLKRLNWPLKIKIWSILNQILIFNGYLVEMISVTEFWFLPGRKWSAWPNFDFYPVEMISVTKFWFYPVENDQRDRILIFTRSKMISVTKFWFYPVENDQRDQILMLPGQKWSAWPNFDFTRSKMISVTQFWFLPRRKWSAWPNFDFYPVENDQRDQILIFSKIVFRVLGGKGNWPKTPIVDQIWPATGQNKSL